MTKFNISTDIGVVRNENQDRAAFFENDNAMFAILCDGMGGHFGGSLAASITVNTFQNSINTISNDEKDVFNWFKESIKKAKQNMQQEAGTDALKNDMGTTVTAAIVFKQTKNIYIFNIGDSRVYIYDGLLHQITVDHNLMNYYIANEGMSEFEAAKIQGAYSLTSALGPNKKTNIEAFKIEKENTSQNISLILTSDGVHDFISKPNFEMMISAKAQKELEIVSRDIIATAIKGGSKDNLTIVIVEVA